MPLKILPTSFTLIFLIFSPPGSRKHSLLDLFWKTFHAFNHYCLLPMHLFQSPQFLSEAAESRTTHEIHGVFLKWCKSFIFFLYCFHTFLFDKGINILMESLTVTSILPPLMDRSLYQHSTSAICQEVGQYTTTVGFDRLFSLF